MSTQEVKPKKPAKTSKTPVMDIVRPGGVMPNASARPVIVGHKPIVQDPMVHDSTIVPKQSTEKTPTVRTVAKVVAPLMVDTIGETAEVVPSVEEEPEVTEATSTESAHDVPELAADEVVEAAESSESQESPVAEPEAVEEPTPEQAVESAEKNPEATDTYVKTEATPGESQQESAVLDAVVGQAGAKNLTAQQAKEDEERLGEQDKLIDSKEYFVPIGERTRKKRRTMGLALFMLVFVALAGGYLAVDKFTDTLLPYEFFTSATQRRPLQVTANTPGASMDQGAEVTKEEVYTNKEFGFQFVLPKGFATATSVDRVVVLDGTAASLAEQGRAFRIDISPKFSGGFVTNDWKLLPRPPVELVEPAQTPLGFTEYPACKATAAFAKILFEDETTCVIATASQNVQGPQGSYVIAVRKKLPLEHIAGLEFTDSPVVMERYTRQGFETALQQNSSRSQDIIRFAKSIKVLQ